MNKFSLIGALALSMSLGACSTLDRAAIDINALLGNSVASTAVAYVVSLNPQVQQVAQTVDADIASVSPQALRVACGGLNMLNLIYKTTSAFLPQTISPTSADAADRVNQSFQTGVCAGPPPANLATAVRVVIAQYRSTAAALASAGVKL